MMHQIINRKIAIYFFLLILFGTMNNKNLDKIKFPKIDKINVSGLSIQKNTELSKELNLLKEKNLFFLDSFEINKILNSQNIIEKFSIFKRYPSTLQIQVKKAKFLAYTKIDGDDLIIGSNGKFIKTKKIEEKIPFIYGNFKINDFLMIEKKIRNSKLEMKKIKNLFFFKSGRWDIETYSGILIKLPNQNLDELLNLSLTIINDNNFEKVRVIDLRQKNQVIING